MFKALKSTAMRALLSPRLLRGRIAFEIRSRYFEDLDIVVPLSPNVSCPIPFGEAWSSFYEIFLQQEYAQVFQRMPLPTRWLDVGCHAGFFTADIVARRDRAGLSSEWEALLVDGDGRSRSAVERFAAFNHVEERLRFVQGVISARQEPQVFVERAYMDSGLAELNSAPGTLRRVSVLTAEEILARFPPPYDLIKLDIEGAERDFLLGYRPLLAATRFLLIEWHHWAGGGITADQTRELLAESGLRLVEEIVAPHECGGTEDSAAATDPTAPTCGVLLFENRSAPVQ